MKKIIAILLAITLFMSGCTKSNSIDKKVPETYPSNEDELVIDFKNLSDVELLQYTEDTVWDELSDSIAEQGYVVDDISAVYLSKEYIEELEYNSQSNVFFGFSLRDLNEEFQGEKYVFTTGENNETVVKKMEVLEELDYKKILKNVLIGTGVILVCVTVSAVTGGTVSAIFVASAKTATTFGLSSGLISGVTSGVVEGIKTGDFEKALYAAASSGSESFKWGAITGAVTGGVSKAIQLSKASKIVPSPRESELRALEKYGGTEQVSYLNGEKVSLSQKGATRPDIVRTINGKLEAIEVKNYNLNSNASQSYLRKELKRQITDRVNNLPPGTGQRIVLDTKGRNYSKGTINDTIEKIRNALSDVYPDIPIDILK